MRGLFFSHINGPPDWHLDRVFTPRIYYIQPGTLTRPLQGGFARVFEVEDKAGSRLAIKVVTKTSLKTKKAKTKVGGQIRCHYYFTQHYPEAIR